LSPLKKRGGRKDAPGVVKKNKVAGVETGTERVKRRR